MPSQTVQIATLSDYRQFDAVQLHTISEKLGVHCLRKIVEDETPITVTLTEAGRVLEATLSPNA